MTANVETEIDQLANRVEKIHVAREEEESLTTTVLSWNINGLDQAEARKQMLVTAISEINPDVMLLQETKASIVKFLKHKVIPEKDYIFEAAGNGEEAMVIYKKDAFKKVNPSQVNLDKVLEKVILEDEIIILREKRVPVRDRIKERSCVVHLRHISTEREIIFVSYHNIRKGGGKDAVKNIATKVCKIIAELYNSTKCFIIAGVDFNCSQFVKDCVTVPEYTPTPRRKTEIKKVDFFILPKSKKKWNVKAIDLSKFHKELEGEEFTSDQLNKALIMTLYCFLYQK